MGTEELLESSLLFLGASFETTAVSLSSIFFMLASNSDKQEKLYCEISSILSSYKDEVTEDMMNQMKYLDLIIKETLRLLPVAVFHARLATDDIEFSKCFIIQFYDKL
jgi:cytochrome P450 family 4